MEGQFLRWLAVDLPVFPLLPWFPILTYCTYPFFSLPPLPRAAHTHTHSHTHSMFGCIACTCCTVLQYIRLSVLAMHVCMYACNCLNWLFLRYHPPSLYYYSTLLYVLSFILKIVKMLIPIPSHACHPARLCSSLLAGRLQSLVASSASSLQPALFDCSAGTNPLPRPDRKSVV